MSMRCAAIAAAAALYGPLIALVVAYVWYYQFEQPIEQQPYGRLFTPDELAPFVGQPKGTPLYIAILGDVFDVTTGGKFYGKGESYEHFAGRDGTRAFSTGDSEGEGLTDDVDGLSLDALQGIEGWHSFYVAHATYFQVGRVVGRYYDARGEPIENAFPHARLQKLADHKAAQKQLFPECNSKWTAQTGQVVWCSPNSGGIAREWPGFPRIFDFTKDPEMETTEPLERCACVQSDALTDELPYLRRYDGCEIAAIECKVPPPNPG